MRNLPGRSRLALLVVLTLAAGLASARAGAPEDRQAALDLIGRGASAFKVGDIASATRYWTDAVGFCRSAGAPVLEANALARRGEAWRTAGHFREAKDDLTAALAIATKAGDQHLVAASSGALGNLALLSRRTAVAEPLLLASLADASQLNDAGMMAASSNDLGNLYSQTGRAALAAAAYANAARYADAAGDQALAAVAEINAGRLAQTGGDVSRAARLLGSAVNRLVHMDGTYQVGFALVAAGSAASGSDTSGSGAFGSGAFGDNARAPASRAIAEQAFAAGATIAERLNNPALGSMAVGGLGRLRLASGRLTEASNLTQQALFRARQADAPEIAFRWEWQQAKIDRALGDNTAALADFRHAVATMQSIRHDIPIQYQNGQSSFRSTFGPVYLEFADLLLRRAREDGGANQALLREARDVVEHLKETELQDYFRDPCITSFEAKSRGIETVAPDTAVIYPIILPDRLEVLVTVGGRDIQFTVPITEAALKLEVDKFRLALQSRATNEYIDIAKLLYEQMMRPIDAVLSGHGITTLVFVPDGVFHTIPLSALYDGQHFLIERYAVATVPGMRLVDPRPLAQEARRMLAAGMSESRDGFPGLPNVPDELDGIQAIEHSTNLLDAAFQRQRFTRSLRETDYTMVHIASHSQLGSDPSQSFILAYDGPLSLDDLEGSIKLAQFREQGLELLTLSACQTAVGDDSAALGMAGLALKAGARSVLATLWFISDDASGQLVVEFYKQLQNTSLSKARALQAAQLKLMEDPLLGHPAYWAPFLLVGNWL
jgi:CHAT domain-containing protein